MMDRAGFLKALGALVALPRVLTDEMVVAPVLEVPPPLLVAPAPTGDVAGADVWINGRGHRLVRAAIRSGAPIDVSSYDDEGMTRSFLPGPPAAEMELEVEGRHHEYSLSDAADIEVATNGGAYCMSGYVHLVALEDRATRLGFVLTGPMTIVAR